MNETGEDVRAFIRKFEDDVVKIVQTGVSHSYDFRYHLTVDADHGSLYGSLQIQMDKNTSAKMKYVEKIT
jgi:hypothetical protein